MSEPALRVGFAIAARLRVGMVASVFLIEAIVAWVLAAPWTELFSRLWGTHPDGDRALWWQRGHIDLVDFLGQHRAELRALTDATTVGLLAWMLVALLPLGALLAALSEEGRFDLRRAGQRAGASFGRLALIQFAAVALSIVAILVFFVLPYALTKGALSAWPNPRHALLARVGFFALLILALAYVVAACDLARALVVRQDRRALSALLAAARSPRAVVALAGASSPRWIASLGALGCGAAFSSIASSVTAIFLAHQVLAFTRVLLRASVLARALRISDRIEAKVSPIPPPADPGSEQRVNDARAPEGAT